MGAHLKIWDAVKDMAIPQVNRLLMPVWDIFTDGEQKKRKSPVNRSLQLPLLNPSLPKPSCRSKSLEAWVGDGGLELWLPDPAAPTPSGTARGDWCLWSIPNVTSPESWALTLPFLFHMCPEAAQLPETIRWKLLHPDSLRIFSQISSPRKKILFILNCALFLPSSPEDASATSVKSCRSKSKLSSHGQLRPQMTGKEGKKDGKQEEKQAPVPTVFFQPSNTGQHKDRMTAKLAGKN